MTPRCEYLGDYLFLCACGYIYDTRCWVQKDSHIHDCPFIPRKSMLTDEQILARLYK